MYYPTLEEAKRLGSRGNLIPIYTEIDADLETPVSAYLKVAVPPYSFLLESVEGGEHIARYSFIGTEPEDVIITGPGQKDGETDPLKLVEKMLSNFNLVETSNLPRFRGGAVGYLSYDSVKYFEELPSPDNDPIGIPESIFMLTKTFLVFDHVRHKILVVSHAHLNGDVETSYHDATSKIESIVQRLNKPLDPTSIPRASGYSKGDVTSNMAQQHYHDMVERCKEYVVDGDVIQVVVSQRLSKPTSAHSFHIYRSLRAINPSPYMYYLELDGFQIVGASPEMLVQVENGVVATHPIAGTRPRSEDDEEDTRLELELRTNEKERAEHIMLLDLGRNDIGRVSKPGTVVASDILEIERYSHVMHLVSHVEGNIQEGFSNYDALRACFPAGTVSGAPKIRAMEIIAELENDTRGAYAGAVGYFDFAGNMDTCITIRTMVVKDGVAHVQAGGGIVYDSEPEFEFDETIHKASALMRAIDAAESTVEVQI
ncbi:MAG: anthranilate synthase component I [SAR202 cluster bacterium]|jgi:anthranilate synthase component 1|nr:anthranilate synthase component I [SAR202 cluster bacterium]